MLQSNHRPNARSQIILYFATKGITGYEIEKIQSAFYFFGEGSIGPTHLWPSTEVLAAKLSDLTCEQWLEELNKLSGANNE
jgi:hypothetical protein